MVLFDLTANGLGLALLNVRLVATISQMAYQENQLRPRTIRSSG